METDIVRVLHQSRTGSDNGGFPEPCGQVGRQLLQDLRQRAPAAD
jgi:hypothetical protein